VTIAERVYGDGHPNTASAHAALGLWYARFGQADAARWHLRESRRIEEIHGGIFVNIAETRLPADGSDAVGRALTRARLERDLALCAMEAKCSLPRVLGLSDALADMGRSCQ